MPKAENVAGTGGPWCRRRSVAATWPIIAVVRSCSAGTPTPSTNSVIRIFSGRR